MIEMDSKERRMRDRGRLKRDGGRWGSKKDENERSREERERSENKRQEKKR